MLIDEHELQSLREDAAVERTRAESPTLGDLSGLDRLAGLQKAFSSASTGELARARKKHPQDDAKAYARLARRHPPEMSLEDMLCGRGPRNGKDMTKNDEVGGGGDDDNDAGSPEDDGVDPVVRHFDRHGFPPGCIANGEALSHMAAARKGSSRSPLTHAVQAPRIQEPATATAADDDTSSEGESESDYQSDDSSDSRPDVGDAGAKNGQQTGSDRDHTTASEDDESDSESDSDSDSAPELTSSKNPHPDPDDDTSSDGSTSSGSDDTSSGSDDSSDDSSDEPHEVSTSRGQDASSIRLSQVSSSESEQEAASTEGTAKREAKALPGHGLPSTKNRNQRKRALKTRQRAAQGNQGAPNDVALNGFAAVVSGEMDDTAADLATRKQALLDSLATSSPAADLGPPDVAGSDGKGTQRRLRLDLNAGRRMLFASLGLRAPKNKADEDTIRANLMKDVRPHANHRAEEAYAANQGIAAGDSQGQSVLDDNPEAWRDKITYRAVECCQDGVELSEPPFPFVQRWDPQQNGAWRRKNRKRPSSRKRRQRTNPGYYEDGLTLGGHDSFAADCPRVTGDDDMITLNYDDEAVAPISATTTPCQTAQGGDQTADVDDLPCLPEELSSLRPLRLGDAEPGMVITWTEWLLSRGTNWEPRLGNVTAAVVGTAEDGVVLEMVLSRRDRKLDRNEKQFDGATGQRIYDRFEAPDLEEEGEDDRPEGYRAAKFFELMNPRIVQRCASTVSPPSRPAQIRPGAAPSAPGGEQTSRSRLSPPSEKDAVHRGELPITSMAGEVGIVLEADLGSASTQPGQGLVDVAAVDVPDISVASESERLGERHPDIVTDMLEFDSPSQQLEDMSEAVLVSRGPSRQTTTSPRRGYPSLKAAENAHPGGSARVDFPALLLPSSSASSAHSGRQPDPDFFVADVASTPPPGINRDMSEHDTGDGQDIDSQAKPLGLSSSDPYADLDEDAPKAARRTRTNNRSSRPAWHPSSDDPMDGTPRRSEEVADVWGDESAPTKAWKIQDNANHAAIRTFRKSISPPTAAAKRQGPTSLGSKHVALVENSAAWIASSGPEPRYTNSYAENSADETYDATNNNPSAIKTSRKRTAPGRTGSLGSKDDPTPLTARERLVASQEGPSSTSAPNSARPFSSQPRINWKRKSAARLQR